MTQPETAQTLTAVTLPVNGQLVLKYSSPDHPSVIAGPHSIVADDPDNNPIAYLSDIHQVGMADGKLVTDAQSFLVVVPQSHLVIAMRRGVHRVIEDEALMQAVRTLIDTPIRQGNFTPADDARLDHTIDDVMANRLAINVRPPASVALTRR